MLSVALDRAAAVDWYRRNRARSAALFDMIDRSAYYSRPIALRNPIVFYEGHLPAFSVLAFLRRGLGRPSVDARLERLFERGIDPESEASAVPRSGASTVWPSRDEVIAFARACDEAVVAAIAELPPLPTAIEGLYTALEHEAMHQETLLYMWHRLPYEQKRRPSAFARSVSADGDSLDEGPSRSALHRDSAPPVAGGVVPIAAGRAMLGAVRDSIVFGWDNEFEAQEVDVPAFEIDARPVTNAQFLDFINAGGYDNRALWDEEGCAWIQADRVRHPAFWIREEIEGASTSYRWRGMFESTPLPPEWPVYVSEAEASAYARWKGRRLMTEPEFHRAAEGAAAGHVDFAGFDPVAVGSYPAAVSRWGVHDLIGNGWEWTSTIFAPFDGFMPMSSYPEYSADFFDGRHYVMKGASPATARELIRPSFRNWFRGNYPYVYAKFRTVRG